MTTRDFLSANGTRKASIKVKDENAILYVQTSSDSNPAVLAAGACTIGKAMDLNPTVYYLGMGLVGVTAR